MTDAGGDVIVMLPGSISFIDGSIESGPGSDFISVAGSSVTGDVDGGPDCDVITVAARSTIDGSVIGGSTDDGADIVVVEGGSTVTGDVLLGDGGLETGGIPFGECGNSCDIAIIEGTDTLVQGSVLGEDGRASCAHASIHAGMADTFFFYFCFLSVLFAFSRRTTSQSPILPLCLARLPLPLATTVTENATPATVMIDVAMAASMLRAPSAPAPIPRRPGMPIRAGPSIEIRTSASVIAPAVQTAGGSQRRERSQSQDVRSLDIGQGQETRPVYR
jgi:hypothetical protein